MMGNLVRDLRDAVRLLARHRGVSVTVALSIGLGIGANGVLFTFTRDMFLRPLQIADPDSVVFVFTGETGQRFGASSYSDYQDFAERSDAFSGLAASAGDVVTLGEGETATRVAEALVSTNYFSVAGVTATIGRTFQPEEGDQAEASVVISHTLWRLRYESDPAIVGRIVHINRKPFTVVGVAAPGFSGMNRVVSVDVWLPITAPGALPSLDRISRKPMMLDGPNRWFHLFGRLKPGVRLSQAQAELNVVAAQLRQEYPEDWMDSRNQPRAVTVVPESEARVSARARGAVLGFLGLLTATAAVVLLMACANVGSLLLARAAARRRETAVRMSLGASWWHLIQQFLVESTVLCLLGGVVGVFIALWAIEFVVAYRPPIPVRFELDLHPDTGMLSLAMLLSVVTGLITGAAPAIQATRAEIVKALKEDSRTASGASLGRWSLHKAFVVIQAAAAVVLLTAAGLLIQNLDRTQSIDPGFDAERLLLLSVDSRFSGRAETSAFDAKAAGLALFRDLQTHLTATPGVESVSLANRLPLGIPPPLESLLTAIEGYEPQKAEDLRLPSFSVGPGYFRTLRMKVTRGREFALGDADGAPEVAVVNQAFVDRYWSGKNPIGKHIFRSGRPLEVVGVAVDGKYVSLNEDPTPLYYVPLLQFYEPEITLLVRSKTAQLMLADTLRRDIQSFNPNLGALDVTSMSQRLSIWLLPARLGSGVLGVFGLVALALCAIGTYGSMSHWASLRRREISVRLALGAEPQGLIRSMIRQGMWLALLGMVIGTLGALVLGRALARILDAGGIGPSLAVALATVTVAALAANYLPARRAANIAPMDELRNE